MFNLSYPDRLHIWANFRKQLETSDTPFEDTLSFWSKAPLKSFCADPWDKATWPDPWEMILENEYCEFVKILAICYTLQLTDRFSQSTFEIHIVQDQKESNIMYILFVDNQAIGYYNDNCINGNDLSKFDTKMQHVMEFNY